MVENIQNIDRLKELIVVETAKNQASSEEGSFSGMNITDIETTKHAFF